MANLTVRVNTGTVDGAVGDSGTEWTEIDLANDYLVFSSGSDVVADGQPIPSQSDLNKAGVLLTGVQQTVSKYFLADISANELKEISLMGNQNKRYVLAFDFDAATASEPVLELWDDSTLLTITGTTLGAGTASNSWWKGITTTAGLPGTNWSGSALAGSASGRYLNLNDGSGALAGADILYANLKIVIPPTATTGSNVTPVFAIKFASN